MKLKERFQEERPLSKLFIKNGRVYGPIRIVLTPKQATERMNSLLDYLEELNRFMVETQEPPKKPQLTLVKEPT
jgi:hypothetical protein